MKESLTLNWLGLPSVPAYVVSKSCQLMEDYTVVSLAVYKVSAAGFIHARGSPLRSDQVTIHLQDSDLNSCPGSKEHICCI